ncbi:hypothetical protein Tco_0152442 [Tanacetum coccineum]
MGGKGTHSQTREYEMWEIRINAVLLIQELCIMGGERIWEFMSYTFTAPRTRPEDEIQANMALMAFTDSENVVQRYIFMGLVKTELEKVKEEKEGVEFKLAKFEKSSKDLDDLLASQVTDKIKKGFGYNVVPLPHPLILNSPTSLDLSYSGLEEFQQPEINEYGLRDSSLKPTTVCDRESNNSKENTDDSLTQQPKTGTETRSVVSTLKVDKKWKEKFFHHANNVRLEEPKKARENTDAPIIEDWVSDDEEEVEESTPKVEKKIPTATKKESVNTVKPSRRTVRAVLMKTGLKTVKNAKPLSTVRSVNTCQRPCTSISNQYRLGFPQRFQKKFDGGYVTFGGGANGGRITSKCTIKTDKLDFEDVYFVKELKFNLFSVSQMCDKKNYVLFTDFECLVLSPNFKLPDESQVLLKIPRQNNMYSFDMKNIVPKDGLTLIQGGSKSNQHTLSPRSRMYFHAHLKMRFILVIMLTLTSVADATNTRSRCDSNDCSFQDNGIDDQQVNTASPQVNTGSRELSTAIPEINTANPEGLMGPIPTTEDIQEEDQVIDLGNLSPSLCILPLLIQENHKDHPNDHVIWVMKDSLGLTSMPFACFLSSRRTKEEFSKALSDPAWVVKNAKDEHLQSKLQNVWVFL